MHSRKRERKSLISVKLTSILPGVIDLIGLGSVTGGRAGTTGGSLGVAVYSRTPTGNYQVRPCRRGVRVVASIAGAPPGGDVEAVAVAGAESAVSSDGATRVGIGISVVAVAVEADFIGSHGSRGARSGVRIL